MLDEPRVIANEVKQSQLDHSTVSGDHHGYYLRQPHDASPIATSSSLTLLRASTRDKPRNDRKERTSLNIYPLI